MNAHEKPCRSVLRRFFLIEKSTKKACSEAAGLGGSFPERFHHVHQGMDRVIILSADFSEEDQLLFSPAVERPVCYLEQYFHLCIIEVDAVNPLVLQEDFQKVDLFVVVHKKIQI